MKRLLPVLIVAALAMPISSYAQDLPPGHPTPGAAAQADTEEDGAMPSPDVPVGSIRVKLVDAEGQPVPHAELKLGVQFNKIAEGEKKTELRAKTDEQGIALFSGLTIGSDFSYRVMASNGLAEYFSNPIQLRADSGVSVRLHVYAVTRSVQEAAVGAMVFVYVETRDDVFQFEVLARFGNRSRVSWVPENARMALPDGFKAFKAAEPTTDVRFEEDPGRGAKLRGTFAPGQQSASFRFQVPRQGESHASFEIGLPPNVGEVRFIAEAAPTMELDVEGFERPQTDVSQSGQRVLVTRRVAVRSQVNGLPAFTARLSGIPTPGWGRWVAALIAGAVAALGIAAFRGKVGSETQAELQERDAARAKRVLLDELVELTRARREQRVGPSTYESARRSLVDALSRVISQNPQLGRRDRKPGKRRAKKSASA